MLKLMLAVAALVVSAQIASAACPKGTRYMCSPGPNGKQICGCF